MRIKLLAGFITGFFLLYPSLSCAEGWEYLFNDKNLDGWKLLGDQDWQVQDGKVVVKACGEEMGWLVTEKEYSDFVLRLRFKWHGGNSGIQIRSQLEGNKMIGYQANLDWGRKFATGSLLEENGRGMLQDNKIAASKLRKEDQWDTYEISAIGDHIMIHVNGKKVVDLHDPQGDRKGIIALQMAPGENAGLEWDDIRILEIDNKKDWTYLFKGHDLSGWHELGDAEWKVKNGYIQGKSKGGSYGWLVSDKEYKDFYFSTRFMMTEGNSGIQFRSWPVENMIHGFQADLAYGSDWINGHLYDQSERGVLVKPDQDFSKIIDWENWNTYEITAIGPKVELFINGVKSIEYNDPSRNKAGIFAFQIHSGMEMETCWKNIRIISFD